MYHTNDVGCASGPSNKRPSSNVEIDPSNERLCEKEILKGLYWQSIGKQIFVQCAIQDREQ